MAGKNTAAFGIYATRSNLENAVEMLKANGFRYTDISVLVPENEGTKDLAHIKASKAPEGAAAGAGTGAVVGGALGWLAGIGALAIPGVGPFIAAGPILAALAGAGVGGTVGGVAGALVGMGIPEYEAKRYEGRIKKGAFLLSVHCDNSTWTKRAKDILKQTGAEDVSSAGEAGADFAASDKPHRRKSTQVDPPLRGNSTVGFEDDDVDVDISRSTGYTTYTGRERRHSDPDAPLYAGVERRRENQLTR